MKVITNARTMISVKVRKEKGVIPVAIMDGRRAVKAFASSHQPRSENRRKSVAGKLSELSMFANAAVY